MHLLLARTALIGKRPASSGLIREFRRIENSSKRALVVLKSSVLSREERWSYENTSRFLC